MIAERTGVSLDTVVRVGGEDSVSHVDDAAERKRRRSGRPSKAARFEADVRGWLEEAPDLGVDPILSGALLRCAPSGRPEAFSLRRS